jgi:hypothetical protein
VALLPRRKFNVGWLLVSVLAIAGCTSTTGRAAGHPPATSTTPKAAPVLAARSCTEPQIESAIGQFFTAWDHREGRSFGQLFETQGILDMATKNQDTLRDSAWTDSAGRGPIAAFAESQWRLGEVLTYHGMTTYTGSTPAWLGGAEVDDVAARFADGSSQPIEEAKFNYNCSEGEFTHVVIISAGVAAKR